MAMDGSGLAPVTFARDAMASSWHARATPGHCGVTTEGADGQCDYGESGSFTSVAALRSGNWTLAASACLDRCARCRRCRYISLSLRHADCSWYATCTERSYFGDFISGRVTGKSLAPQARGAWDISWNASCAARPLADSPLCALWDGRCDATYPSATVPHALFLRRWMACGAAAKHRLDFARRIAGGGHDPVPWYMGVTNEELLANSPVDTQAPTIRQQWQQAKSGCMTRRCIVTALSHRWITFAGDSTHREVYDALLGLLAARYNASYKRQGPTIGGEPIKESLSAKAQADVDTTVTIPWGRDRDSVVVPLVLSFRFLRGLDMHKLRLNALSPHHRFFYPSWNARSDATPTHLVLSGDLPRMSELPSAMALPAPDTFFFHSCAWELPAVNRSQYYYPNSACATSYPPTVAVGLANGSEGRARVHGGACKPRGSMHMSDQTIYAGFDQAINESLQDLPRWLHRRSRVLVRGCHSGVQASWGGRQHQAAELQHMDLLVRNAARGRCLPFLDAWELDRAAGFYKGRKEDFHVPAVGSMQAALSTLLAITAAPPPPDLARDIYPEGTPTHVATAQCQRPRHEERTGRHGHAHSHPMGGTVRR